MHSPAPMPSGSYGMPMNNFGGGGPQQPQQGQPIMRTSNMLHMMHNPEDMIPGGYNQNFNFQQSQIMGQNMSMNQIQGQQNNYMIQNGLGQPGSMMSSIPTQGKI